MAKRKSTKPDASTPRNSDRELFYSLTGAKPTVAKLRDAGKPYDALIDEVLADDGNRHKTAKELQVRLKISPHKLRRWLDELTKDFVELIATDPTAMTFELGQVSFSVWIPGDENEGMYFTCQMPWLAIPQIGAILDIAFMPPPVNTRYSGYIYVHAVDHELKNGLINVTVSAHVYEPFIAQLARRAQFEGKLTYDVLREMGPYDLERFLKALYASK